MFLFFTIGGILLLFSSCKDEKKDISLTSSETEKIEQTELGEIIATKIQEKPSEDFYILYDASSNEYLIFTKDEYILSTAFANIVVRENQSLRSGDPKGNGWIVGGKGKGKFDALRIAKEIADKIEKNRDFEIHVEYHKDGSFTVWYRLIK